MEARVSILLPFFSSFFSIVFEGASTFMVVWTENFPLLNIFFFTIRFVASRLLLSPIMQIEQSRSLFFFFYIYGFYFEHFTHMQRDNTINHRKYRKFLQAKKNLSSFIDIEQTPIYALYEPENRSKHLLRASL